MLWTTFSKLHASLQKDIRKHKYFWIFGTLVLAFALFLRTYRTGEVLGFYFDQGRDALRIWDLTHKGDVFLIGPTTGIAGIFRGPFYYYLITPFYFLSGGDPVLPANFLATTTVVAIAVMGAIAIKIHSRSAALLAMTISAISFGLIFDSRWLSNPTPMLLISVLLVFGLFFVVDSKKWAWPAVSFLAGLSLFHFGSSGEFFYFPALLIILIWKRRDLNFKIIVASILLFLATALPLILFDFKNDHLLSNNIKSFLFERDSFKSDFGTVLAERLSFYHATFIGRLFPNLTILPNVLFGVIAFNLFFHLPKLLKSKYFRVIIILFASPLIGLLFFQGNEGNIYGYYLTGYFLVFFLLVGVSLGQMWNRALGKAFVLVFLLLMAKNNLPLAWSRMSDGGDGPNTIILENQKKAIDWVYENAQGQNFNVDVYVPPVIPYAYDYLFTWRESLAEYSGRVDETTTLLYTIYEVDPPHPERLLAWLKRQEGIGRIEEEIRFGGITAQRRTRLD